MSCSNIGPSSVVRCNRWRFSFRTTIAQEKLFLPDLQPLKTQENVKGQECSHTTLQEQGTYIKPHPQIRFQLPSTPKQGLLLTPQGGLCDLPNRFLESLFFVVVGTT